MPLEAEKALDGLLKEGVDAYKVLDALKEAGYSVEGPGLEGDEGAEKEPTEPSEEGGDGEPLPEQGGGMPDEPSKMLVIRAAMKRHGMQEPPS